MMRIMAYVFLAGLLLLTAIVSLRALEGLEDVVLGFHGILALTLGIALTLALGAGLMFLLFYSARSGHDEMVHRGLRERKRDDG